MGYKKKKKSAGSYTQLFHHMIKSEAWQDLSCYARTVYIEISAKHNGYNNGNLSYTFKEGEKIMHRNTYAKALNELVSHGFIDIVRSGGLNKECNIFALSYRWKKYGTPHFEERERTVFNPNWKP